MTQVVNTEAPVAKTKIIISQPARQAFAKEYADTIGKSVHSDTLAALLAEYSAAKTTLRRGATWVYSTLQAIFTPEQMAGLPVPDSENTDETPTNNPDVYKYQGKNSKGNSTTLRGSFYDDLFTDLPIGIAWQADIDDVNKALDKENRVHASPERRAMSKWTLLGLRKTLNNQRGDKVELVKRAANLAIQFENAKLCPKVECLLVTDEKGQLYNCDEPIMVRDKNWGTTGKLDTFSEASFLRMKFAEASQAENGGDFDEVIDTLGGRDTGEGEGSELPAIEDKATLDEYIAEFAAAIEQTQWQKAITDMLKKDDPNDDATILSLFAIKSFMAVLDRPQFVTRHDNAYQRSLGADGSDTEETEKVA